MLTATEMFQGASLFHIIPNDDDPFDFYIAWEKTSSTLTMGVTGSLKRKRKSISPVKKKDSVLRYLQVNQDRDSVRTIAMQVGS